MVSFVSEIFIRYCISYCVCSVILYFFIFIWNLIIFSSPKADQPVWVLFQTRFFLITGKITKNSNTFGLQLVCVI